MKLARQANPEKVKRIEKNSKLKRAYGFGIDVYEEMLRRQGGCCKICGSDDPKGKPHFAVDHCHATGAIRGLLCSQCNVGLGAFSDDAERLLRAAVYLKKGQ